MVLATNKERRKKVARSDRLEQMRKDSVVPFCTWTVCASEALMLHLRTVYLLFGATCSVFVFGVPSVGTLKHFSRVLVEEDFMI